MNSKILEFLKFLNNREIHIIGAGSNITTDEVYDGVIIKLEKFNRLSVLNSI